MVRTYPLDKVRASVRSRNVLWETLSRGPAPSGARGPPKKAQQRVHDQLDVLGAWAARVGLHGSLCRAKGPPHKPYASAVRSVPLGYSIR